MEMENRTPGSVAELKESRSAQVDESITEVDQASAHLLMSPDQERLLVRKIDKHLLPLLFVSYLLQFLDKMSLGYTTMLGIVQDTNLTGSQYSWASSAFYFGYMVASYPASIGYIKFPIGKYMAVTMIIWAIVLTCHAAAQDFVSLMVLRVLLGVFESAITPGFVIITSMWYKPSEHALRTALWYAGNGLAAVFGGLLSYGAGHAQGGLAPWRWLFIIFGLVTLFWAIVLLFFLPDQSQTTRWLTEEERSWAYQRVELKQKTQQTKVWEKGQVVEAVLDPKTWFFVVFNVVVCLPNGGIGNFSSLIIAGFGFNQLNTLLLGIPSAIIVVLFLLVAGYLSNRYRGMRCYFVIGLLTISLVGILLVRQLPMHMRWGRLIGIWIGSVFGAAYPLSLSLIASNVSGYTKKTTVMAAVFMAYCAGNISGPQVFKAAEAPNYQSAYTTILICFCIAIVCTLGLRLYLAKCNAQRNRSQGRFIEAEPAKGSDVEVPLSDGSLEDSQGIDLSDGKNESFRYCL